MIKARVKELLGADYETRLLLLDPEGLSPLFGCRALLEQSGFTVLDYRDVEAFRYLYETSLKGSREKIALIADETLYLPSDIRSAFSQVRLSLPALYPRLNGDVLRRFSADLPLIDYAYSSLYESFPSPQATERYLHEQVFSPACLKDYLPLADRELLEQAGQAAGYQAWIAAARANALLEYYAAIAGAARDQTAVNSLFWDFVERKYGSLSGVVSTAAPPILPKFFDLPLRKKTALVVADGMSLFDFEVLSRHMAGFCWEFSGSFALIPTSTSFSRQSLLSGKYPSQLENPFSLSREEKEFYAAAQNREIPKQRLFYGRGWDAQPGPGVFLAAIIVNDVDNMVHGQKQGRAGMLQSMTLLAREGKFQALFRRLLDSGFDVILTSDHGNTCCTGIGSPGSLGVEVQTRSKRAVILKDFAQASPTLLAATIPYGGYYLDKNYRYLLCREGESFDPAGERVMTHGGASLEEVIVPFVRIRREKESG